MKGLIKNITDVITNSSSEVFVMNEDNALYYDRLEGTLDCISIEEINWDWIENQGYYEQSMVMDMCVGKLTDEECLKQDKWGDFDREYWKIFIENHKTEIEKNLIGKYWVDIEDHFEDAYEVTENARDNSEWNDYRH